MDGKRGIRKVPLYYQPEAGTTLDYEERRRGSQARAADKHDEWGASCHGDNTATVTTV